MTDPQAVKYLSGAGTSPVLSCAGVDAAFAAGALGLKVSKKSVAVWRP